VTSHRSVSLGSGVPGAALVVRRYRKFAPSCPRPPIRSCRENRTRSAGNPCSSTTGRTAPMALCRRSATFLSPAPRNGNGDSSVP
jgi:hypothetical protein